MRARKIKIKIQTVENFKSEFIGKWRAAEKRLPHADDEFDMVLGLPEITWLSRIFSPERMRLIQVVRDQKPKSISHLAQLLGRAQPNVQRDVTDLVNLGVLELEKGTEEKSEALQPRFNWDGFDIAV